MMGTEQPRERARVAEIEVIYRRRVLEFRRVAAAISRDREAACDIVQEGFVRAVRDLHGFRGEGSLDAWLWRIVVNVAKNHRRDARPLSELPAEVPGSTNGHHTSGAEQIGAAVAALPERQRLVLFLRYYADLDYGSIAQALEVSPGTIGPTLTAARSALQQLLLTAEAAT
jgi:RNA polymerase sigma-70 factor (ECF subfamily)